MTGKLSHLTGRMIPQYVQDSHPQFVTFITSFFEYLERENGEYDIIANLVNTADVDAVIDDYMYFYRKTYAQGFPETMQSDFRFLVKQLKTFYSAKGTEKSIEFLFRTIFDANVKFYYPKVDMLRVSDGKWFQPTYLLPGRHELAGDPGISYVDWQGNNISKIDIFSLVDHKIQGKTSGATAYVDARKELQLAYPDILENYIFLTNDLEWTPVDNATAIIDNRSLNIDRVSNIGDVAVTSTFTNLEESKTYQFRIHVDSASVGTGFLIIINGVTHDYTHDDINNIGQFDIIFVPTQGGDDVITISPIDTGTAGTLRIVKTRLTVQGITYPFFGLSLSDVEGVFLEDEEIEVLNLDYDDFRIVRPIYDIETGIIIPNGTYLNDDGFLSYKKFLQDSFYYQEFSYELQSDIQPRLYLETIKELVHPAGFKLFGKLDVDTVNFVSLNDLNVYSQWIIRWFTENQLFPTERETETTTNYISKATLNAVKNTGDFNDFNRTKEDQEWSHVPHSMLDHYTFYELEAMESENQIIIFVDGLKIPNEELSINNSTLTFDNPPAQTFSDNIEVYRLLGTQKQQPTFTIATNGQTEVDYYDENMATIDQSRLFVFVNGLIVPEAIYTRTITSIVLDNPLNSGDKVEILSMFNTLNHDVYEINHVHTHQHIARGTILNGTSNPIIDSLQMIQNVNELSNLFVFIDGKKLHPSLITIAENRDIRLNYTATSDVYYAVGSIFVDAVNDKSLHTGDGINTVFPLPTITEFEYVPPFECRNIVSESIVSNSEFETDLNGWTLSDNISFEWSVDNGGILRWNGTNGTFAQDLINIAVGDKVKIEMIYETKGTNNTTGISANGINLLDPNDATNNKQIVSVYENETHMIETILEKTETNNTLEFFTDGPIDVHFIRVWKL